MKESIDHSGEEAGTLLRLLKEEEYDRVLPSIVLEELDRVMLKSLLGVGRSYSALDQSLKRFSEMAGHSGAEVDAYYRLAGETREQLNAALDKHFLVLANESADIVELLKLPRRETLDEEALRVGKGSAPVFEKLMVLFEWKSGVGMFLTLVLITLCAEGLAASFVSVIYLLNAAAETKIEWEKEMAETPSEAYKTDSSVLERLIGKRALERGRELMKEPQGAPGYERRHASPHLLVDNYNTRIEELGSEALLSSEELLRQALKTRTFIKKLGMLHVSPLDMEGGGSSDSFALALESLGRFEKF